MSMKQHYARLRAEHEAGKLKQKKTSVTPGFVSSPAFEREGRTATKQLLGKDYSWASKLLSTH